jgi:hypothetical protein
MRHLPVPIPTDQLRGLIERGGGPLAQLVFVLLAIHELGNQATARLQMTDLNLLTGRLLVRRPTRNHAVYLDELTHTRALAWLRERRHLWPLTTNPHLLVSQVTTADTTTTTTAVDGGTFESDLLA